MRFEDLNNFLDCITDTLNEKLGKDISVMRQFPLKTKPHPLNNITVAIGSKKRNLSSVCVGNALTESQSGKQMSVEIEAAVYVPLSMDSKNAYSTIDKILSILCTDAKFAVTAVEHGVLSSNRATGSFELHCTLNSVLYETEEDLC